ncbi:acetyl esterase/lipase [Pedobacter cryoconitis]|uniref:alpha/beta hydrolase n=1 Tax=Pedobacter cryoconitis TaxID=188932 RepID=UPI001614E56C|nr:alpha/beta hydrolase [Pedobacter cryoconitis]MBB6273325.1 acetyl esterase/lipase [Pedobacter cryoconitis]
MNKSWLLLLIMGIIGMNGVNAQEIMKLYPGKIPGAIAGPATYKQKETIINGKVFGLSKVTDPSLSLYKADPLKANGAAVIICPGGGYAFLATDHEGEEVARRFAALGVTALVLKYRLPSDTIMTDKSFGPLQDAQQAIYLVRKNAAAWNINPAKIGIMGFSAGGHLAASLAVHYGDSKIKNPEGLSLRPDFAILIYPVISFTASAHTGSVKNLIGEKATQLQKEYFSNELHVNAQTPVTFLVHANDDDTVPVENTILFNQALTKNKVPVETHLYQAGGHGYGMHNKTTSDDWFQRLQEWMTGNHLLEGKAN